MVLILGQTGSPQLKKRHSLAAMSAGVPGFGRKAFERLASEAFPDPDLSHAGTAGAGDVQQMLEAKPLPGMGRQL